MENGMENGVNGEWGQRVISVTALGSSPTVTAAIENAVLSTQRSAFLSRNRGL